MVEGRRGSLTFFRWSNTEPPKLAHIGLWGEAINNELFALVEKLPDLEFVSLYETSVTDEGLRPLTSLSKLRYLSFAPICRYEKAGFGPPQWSYPFVPERSDRPRIIGRGLQQLASISTLEGLDLLDTRITASDLTLLASWPKLSSLSLPCEINAEAVRHLQSCRRLNQLTLGHREISAAELEQLGAWKSLRGLKVIHARLSDKALQAFVRLDSLESLTLEDCSLTDGSLAQLRTAPRTKTLSLERNEIAGPGIAHLAKLQLDTLGMEFNNISDGTLDQLPQLTSVVDLHLAYCRGITDRGIQSGILQRMTQLRELNLRGCKQVTDASLDDLEKFGHLTKIGIRETSVSSDGVARMKTAMPKTVVFK